MVACGRGLTKEAGGGALPEGMELFYILMEVVTHTNTDAHMLKKTHWVHFLVCMLNFNQVDSKRLKKHSTLRFDSKRRDLQ